MHRSMRAVLRCLTHAAVIAASAAGGTAFAQAAYPSKPIKWIVGYPPGGGTDYLARTVATQMAEQLKQPIVIDNKPGAAGMIGADAAAKAEPDGYTVFTADNGILVYNPALYKKISYNPERDFAPLGLIARVPLIVVAAPSANIKTAADFADNLKRNPGRLSYASPGNGSPHHLAMELLKNQAGLFVVHVPYRGTGPMLTDLMAGRLQCAAVGAPALLQFIKAGRLNCIATGTTARLPQLPDVPTVAEQGYKGFEMTQWYGLLAPARMARANIDKLEAEAVKAVRSRLVGEKLGQDTALAVGNTRAEFEAFIRQEQARWKPVIARAQIKPEGI